MRALRISVGSYVREMYFGIFWIFLPWLLMAVTVDGVDALQSVQGEPSFSSLRVSHLQVNLSLQ